MSEADSEIEKVTRTAKAGDLLHQWMYAEALSAWTFLNFRYDYPLSRGDTSIVYRKRADDYLSEREPSTVCGGMALFMREMGRGMGLTCYYVGGWFHEVGYDISGQTGSNHAWVVFDLDGYLIPSDVTVAAFHRDTYLKATPVSLKGKLSRDVIMPTSPREWEVFLSYYYPFDEASNRAGDRQGRADFLTYSLEDWKRLGASPSSALQRLFREQDKALLSH